MLVIKEALMEDSGIFACRATNAAGIAECAAELIVSGKLFLAVTIVTNVTVILLTVNLT
jgi:hypothetical protein